MTEPIRMPLDGVTASYVDAIRQIEHQIREWSGMRDALRERIEATLGDATEGIVNGRTVVRWTRVSTRRLSTRKVAERFTPEQLDDCYIVTETRRFTLPDVDAGAT